jgi:hypothetical protein
MHVTASDTHLLQIGAQGSEESAPSISYFQNNTRGQQHCLAHGRVCKGTASLLSQEMAFEPSQARTGGQTRQSDSQGLILAVASLVCQLSSSLLLSDF